MFNDIFLIFISLVLFLSMSVRDFRDTSQIRIFIGVMCAAFPLGPKVLSFLNCGHFILGLDIYEFISLFLSHVSYFTVHIFFIMFALFRAVAFI